jgi:hypothetical protein
VIKLRQQGMPMRQVRAAVDARWRETGPSMDTPLPP